jgi:hypothetical protein
MDFLSWLETLPSSTVGKLYQSHWASQAVLRGLQPLAKQYILRLLFVDVPVACSTTPRSLHKKQCLYKLWPLMCLTKLFSLTLSYFLLDSLPYDGQLWFLLSLAVVHSSSSLGCVEQRLTHTLCTSSSFSIPQENLASI